MVDGVARNVGSEIDSLLHHTFIQSKCVRVRVHAHRSQGTHEWRENRERERERKGKRVRKEEKLEENECANEMKGKNENGTPRYMEHEHDSCVFA